jgi:hypothetical protein
MNDLKMRKHDNMKHLTKHYFKLSKTLYQTPIQKSIKI